MRLLPLLLLAACVGPKGADDSAPVDRDGDGYTADDCDDNDAEIHPEAQEVCGGSDEDCDGVIDEVDAQGSQAWYADNDADRFGDPASPTLSCTQPSGLVTDNTDCDDNNPQISPLATEICDGLDNNCDGITDEPTATDALTWHADTDRDSFGDPNATTPACAQPGGFVADNTDCDDTRSIVSPAATEICDGLDNDCDSDVDDDDALDAPLWYTDADQDGFGDSALSTASCTQPSGSVANNSDCDDASSAIQPEADEICDTIDNNCDGAIDEDAAVDAALWNADSDNDGFGDASFPVASCTQPSGFVADDTDCDDLSADTHPGADEICDFIDNNCDGTIDEDTAINAPIWHADTDADGYGDANFSAPSCTQPSAFVADDTDCDDTSVLTNPGADEFCDFIDNNCDGAIDESSSLDALTWYTDADSDNYGDPGTTVFACTQPSGAVADNTDCDDSTAATNPSQPEVCGGADENCDGSIDEDSAVDAITWYTDADGDGHGALPSVAVACGNSTGASSYADDCDESDASIYPGAPETCWDGVDSDCDTNYSSCTPSSYGIGASDVKIYGIERQHNVGHHFSIGDLDQDGVPDIAIMSYANGGHGGAYVMTGPFTADTTVASATWTITSDTDMNGYVDSEMVDLDGSGLPDLVIAAPDSDRSGLTYSGAVLLFVDPPRGTTADVDATATWVGDQAYSHAGYSIAAVDDQDGDGVGDLALTTVGPYNGSGSLAIVRGSDTGINMLSTAAWARVYAASGSPYFGLSGNNLGDVTGDGVADIGTGDFDGPDGVWVLPGPIPAGISITTDFGFFLSTGGDNMLGSDDDVVGVGDLNGDGYDDFVLSQFVGRSFYVVLGPILSDDQLANAQARVDVSSGSHRVTALSGGGDLDGSGTPDIAATIGGAYEFYYGMNISSDDRLYLYLDLPQGVVLSTGDVQFRNGLSTDYLVQGCDSADLNGDGFADLVLGSPGARGTSTGSYQTGILHIFNGWSL